ncbi:hypothetical protein FACS189419_05820 [Planctomycetales bacterium]|nr:hypothetical protein FACS189419_05820 [Planctomycetales bacterium]
MTALGIFAGLIVSQLPSRMTGLNDAQTKRTFTACVGLLNYGYVPIPLIDALFPGDTHISGTLFTAFLGAEISLWTITLLTMQGNFDKASLYRIINIPIITILVSVPLNILFLQSPDCKAFAAPVLDFLLNGQYGPVHLISSAAIPLALLMIGLSITELLEIKPVAARFPVLLKIALCSCLVRLFILPALLIAAAVFLPCTLEIKRVMVVYAAMASAILPIALAKHYGGSTETAFDTCMSNTLVSLFTSPVWITAGLYFIGG